MTFFVPLISPSVFERKGNNLKYNHQIFFQFFTKLILHLTTSLFSDPLFTILTRYSSSKSVPLGATFSMKKQRASPA